MTGEIVVPKLRDMFSVQITGECYGIPMKLKQQLDPLAYDLFFIPVAENSYESAESKRFYATKIYQPMALKNVERNLSAGLYPTVGSIFKHLYYIVQNSYIYNYKSPRYMGSAERTQVYEFTNELLAYINYIMYKVLPDTQSYVTEYNFDLVYHVLHEFRTAANMPTSRLTVEKTLEFVRDIKRMVRGMPESVREEVVSGMRYQLADDSPVLQLARHYDSLRDLRDKLKTGHFSVKKIK